MGRRELLLLVGGLWLLANSLYLASTAEASFIYIGNVLLHVLLGLVFVAWGIWQFYKVPRLSLGWLLIGLTSASGIALIITGASRPYRWLLITHIAVSILTAAWGANWLAQYAQWHGRFKPLVVPVWVLVLGLLGAVLVGQLRDVSAATAKIRNPPLPPLSMEEEGAGKGGPFWPSSARTPMNRFIPSEFFLGSEQCGECHRDIYEQWKSSAHRFASFNNQFYRRTIEHMQEIAGVQPSKWCAGCHDHALLFSGMFERPARELLHLPEAHAGLSCVSCHAITRVHSTMGNADFTIAYPALHVLASSENPWIRWIDRFVTRVDPEPHRRTFMKPFMRNSSEFCSACHKVHLDVPVNHYRWVRGLNEYDNWQASGVSGQGARSFYYPPQPQTCVDCHMPLVDSKDPGNRNGKVHSHRFASANSALAYVNRDWAQLNEVRKFLEGSVSVDIFAATPAMVDTGVPMWRRLSNPPRASSTFAVGEESDDAAIAFIRNVGEVAAPVEKVAPFARPGDTVRLDVVVRTRRVGHFFPGGTVDAADVWLEFTVEDASGKLIFSSGAMDSDGNVDPGAHFYRSYLLDAHGNEINKRNAWQARSVLYVRLIPPGAADTVHYRVNIPRGAKGPLRARARLQFRKFPPYYTAFAYGSKAIVDNTKALVSVHYDDRKYLFGPQFIPVDVAGEIRDHIPRLPVFTIAEDEVILPLAEPGRPIQWRQVLDQADRERWNDWGIGLFLQGDLKGAEYAFNQVTRVDPSYADGWLNVARVLIREGETERARPFVQRALQLSPGLPRALFFLAMIQRAEGDYRGALASLMAVADHHPRDRVVWNHIGRLHFLLREYPAAVRALQRVLEIDPEDVQAHYTLMLVYQGLGDKRRAELHKRLFERFKADEGAQQITQPVRAANPEANNERQPIHEHVSAH